ncbi:MAG: hypothetical protein NC131_13620 [Roseburia sp.]|nr:hypothetical protein [Roseburia sp.]
MQVLLFKKSGTYTDRDGQEKQYTNFYVKCGDSLVPVNVPYFEGEDGRDYQYNGRKEVLKAFADILPDKNNSSENVTPEKKRGKKPQLPPVDDDSDIPF